MRRRRICSSSWTLARRPSSFPSSPPTKGWTRPSSATRRCAPSLSFCLSPALGLRALLADSAQVFDSPPASDDANTPPQGADGAEPGNNDDEAGADAGALREELKNLVREAVEANKAAQAKAIEEMRVELVAAQAKKIEEMRVELVAANAKQTEEMRAELAAANAQHAKQIEEMRAEHHAKVTAVADELDFHRLECAKNQEELEKALQHKVTKEQFLQKARDVKRVISSLQKEIQEMEDRTAALNTSIDTDASFDTSIDTSTNSMSLNTT